MADWESELRGLTVKEIYSVVPKAQFSREAQRFKDELVKEAAQMVGPTKDQLLTALLAKHASRPLKRKRGEESPIDATPVSRPGKRKRGGEGTTDRRGAQRIMDDVAAYSTNPAKFLELPNEDEIRQRQRMFYQATSNHVLAQEVCLACARRLWAYEGEVRILETLPNLHLLKPNKHHPNHNTYNGFLVVHDCLQFQDSGASGWICRECLAALGKNKLPPLSLANQMWIGPVPSVLETLTMPEQMLVALHYPRCFVFKLFPKDGGRRDPDYLQRGMAGNVTTYELNMPEIAKMLEGKLMPRPPRVLASVIAVAFIGLGKVPRGWLKATFRVRRRAVSDALLWLKANNPMYANIDISAEHLEALPDDGVPSEILATFRHEDNAAIAAKERETYVPDGTSEDEELAANPGPVSLVDRLSGEENEQLGDHYLPDVIPLQSLGCCDTDLSNVSTNELMLYALANAQSDEDEGGYAVRRGRRPVNDFGQPRKGEIADPNRRNPLAAAFPCLWPYGEGGIEADRETSVSFAQHVRWCLQYHDRRFATSHSFPFVAFGIQQRREVLRSARLQMQRRNFEADARILSTISLDDLKKAQHEEDQHQPISDRRIRLLKRHLFATGSRVVGSDQMRAGYRSQIWGTSMFLNPPTLWTTWNPCDIHDPIVQILAGEEVDMDNFIRTAGPDADKRTKTVAHDPYAAAQFFNFIVHTMLTTLFGISSGGGRVISEMGLLGKISGYFAVVEAQGRGTLHLHMLLWFYHAPTADEMHELLSGEQFRNQVKAYIHANLRSHLDGLSTTDAIKSIPRESDLAYSRPPNPDSPAYDTEAADLELRLARAQQVHTCKTTTCLRINRQGNLVCKRRAPWPLSDDDVVLANGEWLPKRSYGYLNTWVPSAMPSLRCNHDAKLVTNGQETKDCAWYITGYQTKKQNKSHNRSALLAQAFMYHSEDTAYLHDVQERNRLLIFRCCNAINREQELSGPQVISYLMGWGDVYRSHQYVSIFWSSLVSQLLKAYPDLKKSPAHDALSPDQGSASHKEHEMGLDVPDILPNEDTSQERETIEHQDGVPVEENETLTLTFGQDGRLTTKSQVQDYQFRGEELADMCYLLFLVNTYEEAIPKKERTKMGNPSSTQDNSGKELPGPATGRRGRPKNERAAYQKSHPRSQKAWRVVRTPGHNTLPSIVGKFFPRRDNPDNHDFYCASMLALLKSWRELCDLKLPDQTWDDAFNTFMETAPKRLHDIVAGIQYYYDCSDSADKERQRRAEQGDTLDAEGGRHPKLHRNPAHESDNDLSEDEDHVEVPLTAEYIEQLIDAQTPFRELAHGREALEVARSARIFPTNQPNWVVHGRPIGPASGNDLTNLANWQKALVSEAAQQQGDRGGASDIDDHGAVLQNPAVADDSNPLDDGGAITQMGSREAAEDALTSVDASCLFEEQRRAFEIINWHLTQTLARDSPPQLLMHVLGEGGVGKSKVIQTITDDFIARASSQMLVKAAYTGIAASIIGGSTLHTVGMLPRKGKAQSAETLKKLSAFWADVEYLIIDEISMVARDFLALLSRIISKAKSRPGQPASSGPFGGINVIIFGDLHQFPPVAARKSAPLYWPVNQARDTEDEVAGRKIYEQFITVVKLRRQVRVTDPNWQDLLQHARHGNCKDPHLELLRSLIITNPACPAINFSVPPWNDVVLVTPRHAVRNQWNEAATLQHCARTGNQLFISRAEDTIRGRTLTLKEQYLVAVKKTAGEGRGRADRGGLPPKVPLAVGMKVMVTFNVKTELDIANGARGEIVEIVLDEREPSPPEGQARTDLEYPPAYLLVKMNRTKVTQLDGLPEGVIPITPIRKTFAIQVGKSRKTVTRMQIPLTAAYAFTDYRSQGQTLPCVIVDIATPPTGGLTPFNAYVQLSRSSGSMTLRLLRDFEDKLFTQHPSEFLRLEDARLEKLDGETKILWEERRRCVEENRNQ